MQITQGRKLSLLQCLVEIQEKLLWLFHSCNTLLSSFKKILLRKISQLLADAN